MRRQAPAGIVPLVHIGYAPCGCLSWGCYKPSEEDIRQQLESGHDVRVVFGPVNMGGDCTHVPKWGRKDALAALESREAGL